MENCAIGGAQRTNLCRRRCQEEERRVGAGGAMFLRARVECQGRVYNLESNGKSIQGETVKNFALWHAHMDK